MMGAAHHYSTLRAVKRGIITVWRNWGVILPKLVARLKSCHQFGYFYEGLLEWLNQTPGESHSTSFKKMAHIAFWNKLAWIVRCISEIRPHT